MSQLITCHYAFIIPNLSSLASHNYTCHLSCPAKYHFCHNLLSCHNLSSSTNVIFFHHQHVLSHKHASFFSCFKSFAVQQPHYTPQNWRQHVCACVDVCVCVTCVCGAWLVFKDLPVVTVPALKNVLAPSKSRP